VANNQLTGSVPAEYAQLSQLTTFGVAFNKLNGPLDAVVNALSKLVVIYVRENAFTGTLPLPGPHVAVYDADHNKFSRFPANMCTGTLPGAYQNGHGCDSDWPNQPFNTCCLGANSYTAISTVPPCLKNCFGVTVTSWTDLGTAIAKLKAGDEQSFVLPSTFTTPETGFKNITINENVTVSIFSFGIPVIDAHGKGRMFVVTKGALLIEGVTLQHGSISVGGAILINGGSATLANCMFNGNTATGNGGGAIHINGGNATLTDCTFNGNTATGNGGGAIDIVGGAHATFTECTFNGNTAGYGGAIRINEGNATLANCMFINNTASYGGGGAISIQDGNATLTDCTFNGNTVPGGQTNGGGAIHINGGHATFTECTFNGNTAGGTAGGGAIFIQGGNATLANCMFINNTASQYGGGAIYTNGAHATLTNCTFNGNTAGGTYAAGGGGAIKVYAGEVLIISSSFKGGAGSHTDSVYNQQSSGYTPRVTTPTNYLPVARVGLHPVRPLKEAMARMAGAVPLLAGHISGQDPPCSQYKAAGYYICDCDMSGGGKGPCACANPCGSVPGGQQCDGCSGPLPPAPTPPPPAPPHPDANVNFACPFVRFIHAQYTLPVGQQLEASQLPPATELVHCKPKLP
jgi:predicted outer membrane repeat protein